ncbi:hypothetical protein TTHERM_00768550 (macronuclear) [Tetrahymena thermophila SB210]|uniref:Transmembrane protein n=1 Tax=Tetrahymena thermophila (strain SB210) TaxID=312017 RepID=Q23AU2_TETTS|nr:hypothetical protein TTHERM_00768550 [Tetrahymena thermophila SB210]EAR93600.2 hypothetical protein TTHERM_00768550 [Tetrahymena thermophila SB210]|eukprot:XP_001013845.2 hypothetical protein TTHERM_00768550 [Tetrahymena thermophila SB210]
MNQKNYLLIMVLVQFVSQINSYIPIPDVCRDVYSYFDSNGNQCLYCSKNCALCSSNNNCIQCQQDYYLNEQGQCLSDCGTSLLKGLNSFQCYNFSDINCLKYNQQNVCIVCRDGYILNDDGICKNVLCSQFNGIYDNTIQKCSLDGFLLSDYSREQNGLTQDQDSFDFQYSSLRDDLNEQIVEIIVLEILNHKIVIGRTLQYIVFYDYKTMSAINLLDMQAPITQIMADEKQAKLYVQIQHCDQSEYFKDYVLNTLIYIDLASYQQNIIAQYDDIVDQALFTTQYFILSRQKNLIIFSIDDQSIKKIQTANEINNFCFLQTEGIVLFQDSSNNFYLTNPLFTAYNQINSSNRLKPIIIKSILTQSLIFTFQNNEDTFQQELLVYKLQKQVDSSNQIRYNLGDVFFIIFMISNHQFNFLVSFKIVVKRIKNLNNQSVGFNILDF